MCGSDPVIFTLGMVYFAISEKNLMIIEECEGLWVIPTSHSTPNSLLDSSFRVLSLLLPGRVHLLIEVPSFPTVLGSEQLFIPCKVVSHLAWC